MDGILPLGFLNSLSFLLSSSQVKKIAEKQKEILLQVEKKDVKQSENSMEEYAELFQRKQQELHNPFNVKTKKIFAKELKLKSDMVHFLQESYDDGIGQEVYELQNDFFVNCRDLTYDDRINMLAVKRIDIDRHAFFVDKTTIFYNQPRKIIFIVVNSEGYSEKYSISSKTHKKLPLFFNYMQATSKYPSRFDLYMFQQVLPQILQKLDEVQTMIIFFALQCYFDVEINQYLEMMHEDGTFAHQLQQLLKLFKGVEAEQNYLHYINNIQTSDLTEKSFHVLVQRLGYNDIVKRQAPNNVVIHGSVPSSNVKMVELFLPVLQNEKI